MFARFVGVDISTLHRLVAESDAGCRFWNVQRRRSGSHRQLTLDATAGLCQHLTEVGEIGRAHV